MATSSPLTKETFTESTLKKEDFFLSMYRDCLLGLERAMHFDIRNMLRIWTKWRLFGHFSQELRCLFSNLAPYFEVLGII